jgi:hypothetical protein
MPTFKYPVAACRIATEGKNSRGGRPNYPDSGRNLSRKELTGICKMTL